MSRSRTDAAAGDVTFGPRLLHISAAGSWSRQPTRHTDPPHAPYPRLEGPRGPASGHQASAADLTRTALTIPDRECPGSPPSARSTTREPAQPRPLPWRIDGARVVGVTSVRSGSGVSVLSAALAERSQRQTRTLFVGLSDPTAAVPAQATAWLPTNWLPRP